MALADKLKAKLVKALAKNGTDITITQKVPGAYDPSTQALAAGTTTTTTVKALPEAEEADETDDKLKQRRKLTLANTLSAAPRPGDTLTLEARTWVVQSVTPMLAPGGIVGFELSVTS